MSRSTIANRRMVNFDKNLELRNIALTAISASTAETAIAFAADKYNFYKAVVHAPFSYTGYAAGTAEWQVAIEVSTTIAGTYRQVGIAALPGAGGEIQIPLEGSYVEDILRGAAWIRARAVKVGAPGNLTYGAYLSC